ncbi:MAG: MFS transporter [Clostridia bacterium]|nr:MFS transporter [Clostridia bacterium]
MNTLKNDKKFWIALVVFGLTGQVAWVVENMYFNVFIYKIFNASETDISIMVAVSAAVATLTTMFMGALSDKVGKRKPFICFGYIIWGVTICLFALIRVDVISSLFKGVSALAVGVTLVIIMDGVMTFFGSTANDACFNAWLTDSSNSTNRGRIEGINAMMPLVAVLVVFGGFMGFDLALIESWTAIFLIIGGAVIVIGVLGLFIIKEVKIDKTDNDNYFKNLFYGFRPSVIKQNLPLYFVLIAFAVFGIAIQVFMPYLIIYYEVSLQMADYVLIMAPAIILASVATAFYGKVYDKYGFNVAIIPTIISLCVGFILLYLFKDKVMVFIGSLFMMIGNLAGASVFGAKIRDLTPENKAGMFQGLRIIGQVLIPGIIGPFIGSAVLKNADKVLGNDGTYSFIPNENIFLAALVVAGVMAIVLLLISKFTKTKKGNIS